MDLKLSDPGVHFLEKSKSLPFHELPKDAPSTLDAFQGKSEDIPETPKASLSSPTEQEVEKYGTITFRDDSVSLAELKRRSVSSRFGLLWESAVTWFRVRFRHERRKKLFWILGIVVFCALILVATWGATWYVREIKAYPSLAVLPVAPDLVLEVNINPDSNEYALLEKHASAFPGYALLKKSLDPVGEGKTLSLAIQDSMKRFNLDFEGDIRPVLGESAYVVVSDMRPLGESLLKSTVALGSDASRAIADMTRPSSRSVALSNEALASSRPQVLGDMTVRGVEGSFAPDKPIDFLVASSVRDRKKALEAIEKIRKNSEFEVEPLEWRGIRYFKVSLKSAGESLPDDMSRFVQFRTLYHALIGGNWVFGSSEDEVKRILSVHANRSVWRELVSMESNPTLADNASFQSVQKELGVPHLSEHLLVGYFNVASEEFFKKPECSGSLCPKSVDFFRYPERIVLGWSVGCTSDGMNIRFTNASESESLPGKPEAERFSSRIPERADGRWLNIFSEHDGLKNRFYDFKRTRLTDAGRDAWEKFQNTVRMATTVDIERDVIDHLSESVALSVLTAGDVEPEAVLVAHVDDPQAVRIAIEKVAMFVRNTVLSQRAMFGSLGASLEEESLEALLAKPVFSETNTAEGTIYSFKLSGEFPLSLLSFDFGFRDDVLVVGTHFATTTAFLKEMGNSGSEKKLSQGDFYRAVRSIAPETHYRNSFVVMRGVWDVWRYSMKTMSRMALASESRVASSEEISGDWSAAPIDMSTMESEMEDFSFAMGAILRTVKLVGNDSVSRDGFETSSSRIVIESLPLEEKQRAERILEKFSSGISSMDAQ